MAKKLQKYFHDTNFPQRCRKRLLYFSPFFSVKKNWQNSFNCSCIRFCGIYGHIADGQSYMLPTSNFIIFSKIILSQEGKGQVIQNINIDKNNAKRYIELSAIPENTYEFKGWEGDIISTDNPLKIEQTPEKTSDQYITAVFSQLHRESDGPKIESYTFSPEEIDITSFQFIL